MSRFLSFVVGKCSTKEISDLSRYAYVHTVKYLIYRFCAFVIEPQEIPESYFLDEELDSDYETFISSLKDIAGQSSGSALDKISPQVAASKKKRKKKTGDRSDSSIPVSPISPDPSQENIFNRQNSLPPSDSKEERLSPTATIPVTSSTPQRSWLSQRSHNGTMNRRRLSDFFQQPDKDNVSVVASRSADSVFPNLSQRRYTHLRTYIHK